MAVTPAEMSRISELAAGIMGCAEYCISDLQVLKKGMTNHSYTFACDRKEYILRLPGEGTDQLIDRRGEAAVYAALQGQHISDEVIHIDPDSGIKLSRFYRNARVCDPLNSADVERCMAFLRDFHGRRLSCDREFDIFGQINFYESLWKDQSSCYPDYNDVKQQVFRLRDYIQTQNIQKALTHIDAVPDNFLFLDGDDKTDIRLIDWEYAGMQDPVVDVAMFGIYAMYDRTHMDKLIDTYFENKCPAAMRARVYCYIASCGLLWSNWCEYKKQLGVDFGDYARAQYSYAGDYAALARQAIAVLG